MLAPSDRSTLVDSLRPPPAFQLDLAVGTTYTLNLTTLLVVPTAYAMLRTGDISDDESPSDSEQLGRLTPVGLLDALRRVSGRLMVFCDAAQIAPPARTRRALLGLIEEAVVPALAPNGGAFHPKLWVLRFRDAADQLVYRLLVGTRNLTFDRCWDTIAVLESDPDRAPIPGAGQALRDLSGMASQPLAPERRDSLHELATGLDNTGFAAPPGFDQVRLYTFGVSGDQWPFPERCNRLLVVSPFLSNRTLKHLPAAEHRRVLVSCDDALVVTPAADGFECYTLAATLAEDLPAEGDSVSASDPGRTLIGLHAKLYIAELDEQTVWWTGSANATEAAFTRNVETMLELATTERMHSVGELLRQRGERDPAAKTFRDLLTRWVREKGEQPTEFEEDALDELRRQVAAVGFTAIVTEVDPDRYRVEYASDGPLNLPPGVELRCWAATDNRPSLPTEMTADGGVRVAFTAVLRSLTAFLTIELDHAGSRTGFAVRCRLIGAPENRRQRLIADLLSDPDRLLRYLLALLADEDTLPADEAAEANRSTWDLGGVERLPLTELMMRALAHDPAKLREVSDLLATIRQAGQQLPPSLATLWDSVWRVASERSGGSHVR